MRYPPITDETMQEVWKYGCRKYRRSKKAYVIRNIIYPLGLFLFSISFLTLSYGVLYTMLNGVFQPFLRKIPYTEALWLHLSSLILDPLPSALWQLAGCAVFLYAPAAAAALVIALIFRIFYFPIKPILNESPSLFPQSLTGLCEKLRHYQTPWRERSAVACRVVYLWILYAVCIGFLAYFRNSPDMIPVLQIGWIKISLYFILGFFVIYGLYCLLVQPLFLLFRLLSSSGRKDHFVLDAEYYCRQKIQLSCNLTAHPLRTMQKT